ncbi:MAG: IS6 family transposase [Candidatus Thermoplasmatota archaeon]|nr:IS6 family transposase [Candidatus Thermoplasmatota archaeon]
MPKHKEITVTERTIACRFCGSTDLIKYGKYKNKQYYFCKNCKRKSMGTDAYPKMQYPKELVVSALTYYYNGMSCNKIVHTFNDIKGLNMPKSTVWRWIIKYSKMVNEYVLSLKPHLSEIWIADETVVNIWGEQYWYWDIIDTDTRFLIASHLSKTRTMDDAIELFSMAKQRSKTRPEIIITDRLNLYHPAFNRVFYTRYKEGRVEHLTSMGFRSAINTNLIERFHGTIKQRYKTMRDLKDRFSASVVLDGFVTHYNFFLEHSYLDMTPAYFVNIGENINNWGDLITLAYSKGYNDVNNLR